MNPTKSFLLGMIAGAFLFGAVAFLRAGTAPAKEFANVSDTPENRLRAAQLVIDSYPSPEFARAVVARVEQVVGKEVTNHARRRFRAKTDAIEFNTQRAKFLATVFTPAELETLASILATPTGQTLIEKLSQHDELWRQYLNPMLLEILSGQ